MSLINGSKVYLYIMFQFTYAVAHRDYTSHGSVQVMLFKDRLEIWNPGHLPSGLNTIKLRKPHSSIPANPLLAEPMYLAGYIERMGTGTGDIIRLCEEAGLKAPEYIQEDEFKVIIWRTLKNATLQATHHATHYDTLQAIEEVRRVVQVLDGEMKRADIQDLLGLKDRVNFVSNYLTASNPNYTLAGMKLMASSNKGRCLSPEYKGLSYPLAWQCKEGHTWDMTPDLIANGAWCPKCTMALEKHALALERTYKRANKLARKYKGICLQIEVKPNYPAVWQCEKGHVWKANYPLVHKGHWCKKCRRDVKLQKISQLAEKKGGHCLSTEFIAINKKLRFICDKGHRMQMTPEVIYGGGWCNKCMYENRKLTIEEMQRLAEKRGGKCCVSRMKGVN
jgi:hypothetical protein